MTFDFRVDSEFNISIFKAYMDMRERLRHRKEVKMDGIAMGLADDEQEVHGEKILRQQIKHMADEIESYQEFSQLKQDWPAAEAFGHTLTLLEELIDCQATQAWLKKTKVNAGDALAAAIAEEKELRAKIKKSVKVHEGKRPE